MEVKIRRGQKADLPCVLALIKELAEFEKALDEVSVTLEELENDGFGQHPYYWINVAIHKDKIIGLSFYFIRYSTWKGRFLFLEDFVVKEDYRGQGVGAQLFEETIRIAQRLKVKGMVWQVVDWNEDAIRFYKKYEASIQTEWLNGKLSKEQLNAFELNESI